MTATFPPTRCSAVPCHNVLYPAPTRPAISYSVAPCSVVHLLLPRALMPYCSVYILHLLLHFPLFHFLLFCVLLPWALLLCELWSPLCCSLSYFFVSTTPCTYCCFAPAVPYPNVLCVLLLHVLLLPVPPVCPSLPVFLPPPPPRMPLSWTVTRVLFMLSSTEHTEKG
jgi:hypothetical protein